MMPLLDKGHGSHDGDPPALLSEAPFDGKERGLGIEGVKNRLDQEEIRSSIHEASDLFPVGRDELVEGNPFNGRVVHVRRDGGRPVRRPHGPGHKPCAGRVLGSHHLDRLPGYSCPRDIELVGKVRELVIRQRHGR